MILKVHFQEYDKSQGTSKSQRGGICYGEHVLGGNWYRHKQVAAALKHRIVNFFSKDISVLM